MNPGDTTSNLGADERTYLDPPFQVNLDPPPANTVTKHCAICACQKEHTIVRESADTHGRGFTVTGGMCDTCHAVGMARWTRIREALDRARKDRT